MRNEIFDDDQVVDMIPRIAPTLGFLPKLRLGRHQVRGDAAHLKRGCSQDRHVGTTKLMRNIDCGVLLMRHLGYVGWN